MALLFLSPLPPKSRIFPMIPIIYTTTLQPPMNGLFIVMSVNDANVVEIMVLIIARNPLSQSSLHRTELFFRRRGKVAYVMVAVLVILMVTKTIKEMETMNGTGLEWQTFPTLLMLEFNVLMRFGWLVVANVIPGVAISMLTPLVSMMSPFCLVPSTTSLPLIHFITIIPQTIMVLEIQLLLWILQLLQGGYLKIMIAFKCPSPSLLKPFVLLSLPLLIQILQPLLVFLVKH